MTQNVGSSEREDAWTVWNSVGACFTEPLSKRFNLSDNNCYKQFHLVWHGCEAESCLTAVQTRGSSSGGVFECLLVCLFVVWVSVNPSVLHHCLVCHFYLLVFAVSESDGLKVWQCIFIFFVSINPLSPFLVSHFCLFSSPCLTLTFRSVQKTLRWLCWVQRCENNTSGRQMYKT